MVTKETTAVQWLTAEQTRGKRYGFLYTQLQPIHARSLFPCQDTPFIKATYRANVKAPPGMTALMSALSLPRKEIENSVFEFAQHVPIPAYLVALAVGQLSYKDVGPRSRVYAEPALVEAAALEFDETEQFLQIAETLATPYSWGRYDMLVLPIGFPFGGNILASFIIMNLYF